MGPFFFILEILCCNCLFCEFPTVSLCLVFFFFFGLKAARTYLCRHAPVRGCVRCCQHAEEMLLVCAGASFSRQSTRASQVGGISAVEKCCEKAMLAKACGAGQLFDHCCWKFNSILHVLFTTLEIYSARGKKWLCPMCVATTKSLFARVHN